MTVQVWGAALAIVGASLLLGYAVSWLGFGSGSVAPAVGLSMLIVICGIAIKLPGRATTAAITLVIALLASALVIVRRSGRIAFPVASTIAALIAAIGAGVPFIANGRVGLLGVSLDNDTASHLIYAEALRSSATRSIYGLPNGYPLGPHSLVATLSSGLDLRLDLAFTGLLIAIVIITALVAAAALRRESAWKRVVAGALGALVYLVAAYYAEGAFKEPLMGLLLLAMVLHLEHVREAWADRSVGRWPALVTVSLLMAGGVYVYSYPALAWFGLTLVIWLFAEAATRPGWRRRWRAELHDLMRPTVIAGGLLLILLAPILNEIFNFAQTVGVSPAATGAITTSSLGNLAHALSPYEAFGIWNSPDFRLFPANIFHAGELSAFALGVVLLGIVWSLARREFLLPAAIAACAIVYWRSSHGQSPYVTAKALVIPGPAIVVAGLRGLLGKSPVPLTSWLRMTRFVVAAVFIVLVAHSSYLALRDEPVWPGEPTRELLSLSNLTRGQTVLFLGNTDYAAWLFSDSKMSTLSSYSRSLEQAAPRRTKPAEYSEALDFDSVDPITLDRFRWVVTTNTPYASQAPQNFRLVKQLSMYQLWERAGATAARLALDPPGSPGAVLGCGTPAGRFLRRHRGVASVMAPPVLTPTLAVLPGATERVSLALPRGKWDLSMQYVSPVDLNISAGPSRWRMPAYLDRPGPFFSIGSVTSDGTPLAVTIRADRPSSLTGPGLIAQTTALAATRSPNNRTLMSLDRSCGHYIDWYHFS